MESATGLELLFRTSGLKEYFLLKFHPNSLEDIQGVVSLWTLGFIRDAEAKEHFSKGMGNPRFLYPPRKEHPESWKFTILDMLAEWNEDISNLSNDEIWYKYQFMSVIPLQTYHLVRKGLKARAELGKLLLLSEAADANTKDDLCIQRSAMHRACMAGLKDLVAQVLLEELFKVDQRDNLGKTGLLLAAEYDHTDLVEMLARRFNADLDAVDIYGICLLSHAATNGNIRLAEMAINNSSAAVNSLDFEGKTAFMCACENGNRAIVDLLQSRCSFDADARDDLGYTALMYAAEGGHAEIVNMLVTKSNANLDAVNIEGQTAHMLAVEHGHKHVAEILADNTDMYIPG